jgi:hypothetical protein
MAGHSVEAAQFSGIVADVAGCPFRTSICERAYTYKKENLPLPATLWPALGHFGFGRRIAKR